MRKNMSNSSRELLVVLDVLLLIILIEPLISGVMMDGMIGSGPGASLGLSTRVGDLVW